MTHLQHYFPNNDVFFVGGAIRDLLLGTTDDPKDIDITMAGHPDTLRDSLPSSENDSRFRTEKFGTFTLIPKDQDTEQEKTAYEITPFRTEGGYGDFRHPDEITRSHDLVADSRRRDFTINCLYVFCANTFTPEKNKDIETSSELPEDTSISWFHQNSNTLVLKNEEDIQNVFHQGVFSPEKCKELLDNCLRIEGGNNSPSNHTSFIVLIDPHGGTEDLLERKIRTVGNPFDRFTEDALRILRGVRFVNILNQYLQKETNNAYFDFDNTTWDAMKKSYYLVAQLAKERLHQELMKVFQAKNPFGYICLLDELHLLHLLFPALEATKGARQPVRYHSFDVYEHTLLTLYHLQQLNDSAKVKLAMLYHDVGKPDQYYFYSQNISKEEKRLPISGHMYHTHLGLPLVERDMQALGCSKKQIEEIAWYVKMHHRPGEIIMGNPDNVEKKVRKLISEAGIERVCNLIDIAIADRSGQYNPIQPPQIEPLIELKQIAKRLYEQEGRFTLKELAVDGNDIMKKLDIQPGPIIGTYLERAFDRVLRNIEERNDPEKIYGYISSLPKVE